MDESKLKEIEARLRQMIRHENQSQEESQPAERQSSGAKVIRRRKGAPDVKIM